jgi:hypothetical protein
MRGIFKKADVERYAAEAHAASEALKWAGMRNIANLTPEERAKSAVEYRILGDKAAVAAQEYELAFQNWSSDGYPE